MQTFLRLESFFDVLHAGGVVFMIKTMGVEHILPIMYCPLLGVISSVCLRARISVWHYNFHNPAFVVQLKDIR